MVQGLLSGVFRAGGLGSRVWFFRCLGLGAVGSCCNDQVKVLPSISW